MANKPTNPQLYSRVKSEAKKKFDRWPSAYGSAWLVKEYKRRGGGYRKAEDGMEIPGYDLMANGGMMYGDYMFPMMDDGGEMALGQIAAVTDKMSKLQQFLNPNSEIEPWIASKLAVMDHSADAIYDYMMYNPEALDAEEPEMEEMRNGGIPNRYKNMGFNKVGVKKKSNRPGKKWMVLAKKGDKYKVVHGGYKGMKDFTQHRNENRRDRFWNRMGGRNSAKATDPFSPLYWHKRFGTWAEGGEPQNEGFQALPEAVQAKIMANMMYGGYLPEAVTGAEVIPLVKALAPAVIGALNKNKQPAPQVPMQVPTQAPINIYNVSPQQSETLQNPYNMKRPGQNVYDYAMGGMPCYKCGGQMKYKKGGTPFIAMAYFGDGGINIDPAKKGTFKAQATRMGMSVQEAAEEILNAPKGKYSPEMRRKANFARNFAKEYGGMIPMAQFGMPMGSELDEFNFQQAMTQAENPMGTEPELDFSAFQNMEPMMEISDNEKIDYIPGASANQIAGKNFMFQLSRPGEQSGRFNPTLATKNKMFSLRGNENSKIAPYVQAAGIIGKGLINVGSFIGKRAKENRARNENIRRSFSDNLFPTTPLGITGERGNFDVFGNFRPDETLASRTYFSQMGGEIEMTDDQIRQLVALGAEIEILD